MLSLPLTLPLPPLSPGLTPDVNMADQVAQGTLVEGIVTELEKAKQSFRLSLLPEDVRNPGNYLPHDRRLDQYFSRAYVA